MSWLDSTYLREGRETVQDYLMGDIRSSLADIPVHLAHDTNVLVTVQQRVLFILSRTTAAGGPVGLQAGVGKNHNQPLGVLVVRRNGDMLLRNELRQLGRGA